MKLPIAQQSNHAALLKPSQCAALINVSRRTLTNWDRSRVIPSIKIGRLRLYDLTKVKAALEKFEHVEITR